MPLSPPSPPPLNHSSASTSSSTLHCAEDSSDVASWDADAWTRHRPPSSPDESVIANLIESESQHLPLPDYLHRCQDRSVDVTARQDSINWMLKVHAYHKFSPVTALLSVNYFDRFLSSHSLPQANGWPFQLLSVACLSLAAKMEEPQVPLPLDLQLFEPRFVFEPKTVQRMELRVMATLDWRLRSITPFDYLHCFISNFLSCSSRLPDSFSRVFSSSSDLILSTTRAIEFLRFQPSTIAAAAVLCAAGESFGVPAAAEAYFHEKVNKEMVRSCHQLMLEYLVDTCQTSHFKLRVELPVAPPSPVGVLDAAACTSCDTRSENPGSSSRAEPSAKRLRTSAPDVQQR